MLGRDRSARSSSSAAWLPSSIACAKTALVVGRQQIDAPDLLQVHAHGVGGAARVDTAGVHPLAATAAATRHQPIGVLGRRRARRRRPMPSSGVSSTDIVDGVVDADVAGGYGLLHLFEHVAGQLDRAEHMRDLLGVEHAGDRPAREQTVPLAGSTPGKGADSVGASDCPKLNHAPHCAVGATLATARPHRSLQLVRRSARARDVHLCWRRISPDPSR